MLKAKTLSAHQPVYQLLITTRSQGRGRKWILEVCLPQDETITIPINNDSDRKTVSSLLRAIGIIPVSQGVAHGEI